jgi:ATP-dependent Zn protease
MSSKKALTATAYHEAGHVVAAIELGKSFKYVTIAPGEDSLGHIRTVGWRGATPDIHMDSRMERRIDSHVLWLLAGMAAEWTHSGRRNWRGAGSDFDYAIDVAIHRFPPDTVGKYLDYMLYRARDFVQTPVNWKRIEAIAAALLTETRLSARQCREIGMKALDLRKLRPVPSQG